MLFSGKTAISNISSTMDISDAITTEWKSNAMRHIKFAMQIFSMTNEFVIYVYIYIYYFAVRYLLHI